jgi:hypothetical protein
VSREFLWGKRRGQEGAVAVEFALILPIFLLLVFGVVQFSFWFFSGQSGSSAAREAARRAAVGDLTCSELTTTAQNHSHLVASGFNVTRQYFAPTDTTMSAPRAAGAIKVGDNARLVVQYKTIDMHFPLIPVPSTGGIRAQITESAVARVETVTTKTVPC